MTSAMLVNSGKPTTTPATTSAAARHVGRGARTATSTIAASPAATTARPNATNHGSRSSTATFVAGSESEKAKTPRGPRPRALSSRFR